MKYNKILTIILIGFLLITDCNIIFADAEYDVTPPEIKSFEIIDSDNLDADKPMSINMVLQEDGTGVSMLGLTIIDNSDNSYKYIKYIIDEGNYLFTGLNVVNVPLIAEGRLIASGDYSISSVVIYDAYDNKSIYMIQKDEIKGATKNIHINNDNVDESSKIKVQSISLKNNAEIFAVNNIYATISMINEMTPSNVEMSFVSSQGNIFNAKSVYCNKSIDGTYEVKMYITEAITINLSNINQIIKPDTYYLSQVKIYDENGVCTYIGTEEMKQLCVDSLCIKEYIVKNESLQIDSFEIINTNINTPGVMRLRITSGKNPGIVAVSVNITNENGNKKFLYSILDEKFTGKALDVLLPVNTFLENGNYNVESISVYLENEIINYEGALLEKTLKNKHSIEIKSAYDIVYYGSTANVNGIVNAIENMKDGEYAIIDYSGKNVADKRIFEIMADRNVNVVFQGKDVQWIFNGRDIDLSQCKNINLNVAIKSVPGEKYGYSNQEEILVMDFADNGKLPGKAIIRISNDYLKAKYSYKQNLVLCYYDKTPELIKSNVKCSEDGYAQIEISHNSTYILSDRLPRLAAPTDVTVASSKRKISIKWKSVYGALGYRLYQSSEENGTYELVGTTDSLSFMFTKNPGQYYYRVCAYGKNVEAIMSSTKGVVVKPSKPKLIKIKTITKKVKGKKVKYTKYRISTADTNVNFEIYAKKGKKFKKIKRTKARTIKINTSKYKSVRVREYIIVDGNRIYGKYSKIK